MNAEEQPGGKHKFEGCKGSKTADCCYRKPYKVI